MSRQKLTEAVNAVSTGLTTVFLSEPLRMANYERFAWLEYKSEEMATDAIPNLETLVITAPKNFKYAEFRLSPIKNN